eukprot:gene5802-biopygen9208
MIETHSPRPVPGINKLIQDTCGVRTKGSPASRAEPSPLPNSAGGTSAQTAYSRARARGGGCTRRAGRRAGGGAATHQRGTVASQEEGEGAGSSPLDEDEKEGAEDEREGGGGGPGGVRPQTTQGSELRAAAAGGATGGRDDEEGRRGEATERLGCDATEWTRRAAGASAIATLRTGRSHRHHGRGPHENSPVTVTGPFQRVGVADVAARRHDVRAVDMREEVQQRDREHPHQSVPLLCPEARRCETASAGQVKVRPPGRRRDELLNLVVDCFWRPAGCPDEVRPVVLVHTFGIMEALDVGLPPTHRSIAHLCVVHPPPLRRHPPGQLDERAAIPCNVIGRITASRRSESSPAATDSTQLPLPWEVPSSRGLPDAPVCPAGARKGGMCRGIGEGGDDSHAVWCAGDVHAAYDAAHPARTRRHNTGGTWTRYGPDDVPWERCRRICRVRRFPKEPVPTLPQLALIRQGQNPRGEVSLWQSGDLDLAGVIRGKKPRHYSESNVDGRPMRFRDYELDIGAYMKGKAHIGHARLVRDARFICLQAWLYCCRGLVMQGVEHAADREVEDDGVA